MLSRPCMTSTSEVNHELDLKNKFVSKDGLTLKIALSLNPDIHQSHLTLIKPPSDQDKYDLHLKLKFSSLRLRTWKYLQNRTLLDVGTIKPHCVDPIIIFRLLALVFKGAILSYFRNVTIRQLPSRPNIILTSKENLLGSMERPYIYHQTLILIVI